MDAPPVTSCRTWIIAAERERRLERSRKALIAFWGQDYCRLWPQKFEVRFGRTLVSLKAYFYPVIQISWYVQAGGISCTTEGAQDGIDFRFVGMTVRETRELARELRFDLEALERWLAGALEVCGCDPVTDAWRLG